MKEVLITTTPMMVQRQGSSLLKTLGFMAILVIMALSTIRYEAKINQLEVRLEILEAESIIKETLGLQVQTSDLIGGEIKFITPSDQV